MPTRADRTAATRSPRALGLEVSLMRPAHDGRSALAVAARCLPPEGAHREPRLVDSANSSSRRVAQEAVDDWGIHGQEACLAWRLVWAPRPSALTASTVLDNDIRRALRARAARVHADDPETRIVEEVDLGLAARAD